MRRKPLAAVAAAVVAAALAISAPGTAHADDTRDNQWYLNTFDIDKIHQLSQGAGVTIGVIDSGVDADQQDLEGSVKPGKSFTSSSEDGLTDKIGHGTAVTATLAGHGHGDNGADGIMGIAPNATIIPVAFDWEEDPHGGTDHLGEAIDWLVAQNVDIITTSMDVGSTQESTTAIDAAVEAGIPIVGATGNLGGTDSWGQPPSDMTTFPARAQGVIPVAGTTQDGTHWDKSITLEDAALTPQLGLSAPAVDIPIALPDNKYDTVNGTSFSAPIVAGTLALIKSAYPNLDYTTWLARMIETVDDKGDKGYDDKYGWGIVNPYKALSEDVEFDDGVDHIESNADDILPLDQQGQDTGDDGGDEATPGDDATGDDSAAELEPDAGIPTWAIIAAAALVLAIAVITLILIIRGRTKTNKTHQHQTPFATTGPHQQVPTPSPGQPTAGPPGPITGGQPIPPGQQPPGQSTSTVPPPGAGQPHPGQPPAGPPPPDQNPYLNRPPN